MTIVRFGSCFAFPVIPELDPKFYPPQYISTPFRNSACMDVRYHRIRTVKSVKSDYIQFRIYLLLPCSTLQTSTLSSFSVSIVSLRYGFQKAACPIHKSCSWG